MNVENPFEFSSFAEKNNLKPNFDLKLSQNFYPINHDYRMAGK